jgi:ACS family tartrate transporter-like MFS transporter
MTWLIAQWTPPWARARAMAGVLIAVPLSMVLGGPLCGWLLGLDDPFGMSAWRSMFLILAFPNFLLAVIAGFYFVDKPSNARWLDPTEKLWLEKELASTTDSTLPAASIRELALNPWLWRCVLTWFLIMTGSYALVYWLPQLVRTLPVGDNELLIATISAFPLLGLALGLVFNSKHSDISGERLLHVGLPSAAAGIAMFIAAGFGSGWAVLILLFVAGFGIGAAQGVFWTVPSFVKLGGAQTSVGAIAFISMAGTAGGIVGPWLIGEILSKGGTFSLAIAMLAALLVISLFVIAYDQFGRIKALI